MSSLADDDSWDSRHAGDTVTLQSTLHPNDLTIGWQNLNLQSHSNATLAPQTRQARAIGENWNYVTLALQTRQAKSSGENLNYSESLFWHPKSMIIAEVQWYLMKENEKSKLLLLYAMLMASWTIWKFLSSPTIKLVWKINTTITNLDWHLVLDHIWKHNPLLKYQTKLKLFIFTNKVRHSVRSAFKEERGKWEESCWIKAG